MARKPHKFKFVSIYPRGDGYALQYRVPGDRRRSYEQAHNLDDAETRAGILSNQIKQAKLGLLDAGTIRRKRAELSPLNYHIEKFRKTLVASGVTPKQAELAKVRLTTLMDAAEAKVVADILPGKIMLAIGTLRQVGPPQKKGHRRTAPLSAQTALHYIRHAKQFSTYLKKNHLTENNVLEDLSGAGLDVENNRVYTRRVPSDEELGRLIGITANGKTIETRRSPRQEMSGQDRSLCYWTIFETGFRAAEAAKLIPGHFHLGLEAPYIELDGRGRKRVTKNKDTSARQYISPELATKLAFWLNGKPQDKPVFHLPARTALMLRNDCKVAGVAYEVDGDVFDFHAGRYVCGSRLVAAGINIKVVQEIMRHSDIKLTMNRYAKAQRKDVAGAIQQIAPLKPVALLPQIKGTSGRNKASKGTIGHCGETLENRGFSRENNKPTTGIEPVTCGLQNRKPSDVSISPAITRNAERKSRGKAASISTRLKKATEKIAALVLSPSLSPSPNGGER